MPNIPATDCLLLCAGSDCYKKQRTAFRNLRDAAKRAGIPTATVKCQGSCAGPTAVVKLGDNYRWFEKLQQPQAQADIVDFAAGRAAKPSGTLVKLELKGKKAKKAAKKLGV